MPGVVPIVSCYEAGRDGFWLHRYLVHCGVANVVVDASSIEVNRRARRAKTDRVDVEQLLRLLIRYHHGEKRVWSVVHVPSAEEEDARRLHRELERLKKERRSVGKMPACGRWTNRSELWKLSRCDVWRRRRRRVINKWRT